MINNPNLKCDLCNRFTYNREEVVALRCSVPSCREVFTQLRFNLIVVKDKADKQRRLEKLMDSFDLARADERNSKSVTCVSPAGKNEDKSKYSYSFTCRFCNLVSMVTNSQRNLRYCSGVCKHKSKLLGSEKNTV